MNMILSQNVDFLLPPIEHFKRCLMMIRRIKYSKIFDHENEMFNPNRTDHFSLLSLKNECRNSYRIYYCSKIIQRNLHRNNHFVVFVSAWNVRKMCPFAWLNLAYEHYEQRSFRTMHHSPMPEIISHCDLNIFQ